MLKKGGQRNSVGDLLRAAVITAVENDASRDALSDREALRAAGWMRGAPSAYSLRRAMKSSELRDALRLTFAEVAKMVYHLERWYVVDGTHMKTPFYRKSVRAKNKNEWRKVKIAQIVLFRGLKTGVPVAVHISDGDEAEQPTFAPMLEGLIARGASIRGGGILSDAGFNAREHYELVAKHGGQAFLDVDSNAVDSGGKYPHFDAQLKMYDEDKDRWHNFYDFRSLIETTNHAVKSVKRVIRAQSEIARENEVLALVLGYALSRLPELRLVHRIDLPFMDERGIAFIDAAVAKKRTRSLGPEELRVEAESVIHAVSLERIGGHVIHLA